MCVSTSKGARRSVDFYEAVASKQNAKRGVATRPNGVVTALDSMEEKDREALLKALNDPNMEHKVIFEVLRDNGFDVSYDQVRRFRSGAVRVPDDYRRDS